MPETDVQFHPETWHLLHTWWSGPRRRRRVHRLKEKMRRSEQEYLQRNMYPVRVNYLLKEPSLKKWLTLRVALGSPRNLMQCLITERWRWRISHLHINVGGLEDPYWEQIAHQANRHHSWHQETLKKFMSYFFVVDNHNLLRCCRI